eukprot:TRINITY_DN28496_c0_g1_i4.p1 TRINITY_DN28496_c0_g1~~TRINITY_DN28496_c0_g1_i4.p1  ORF type:complete len:102 (-),score=2.33 TRINITY_DN28496_c0_g1_i4:324-629(-)
MSIHSQLHALLPSKCRQSSSQRYNQQMKSHRVNTDPFGVPCVLLPSKQYNSSHQHMDFKGLIRNLQIALEQCNYAIIFARSVTGYCEGILPTWALTMQFCH